MKLHGGINSAPSASKQVKASELEMDLTPNQVLVRTEVACMICRGRAFLGCRAVAANPLQPCVCGSDCGNSSSIWSTDLKAHRGNNGCPSSSGRAPCRPQPCRQRKPSCFRPRAWARPLTQTAALRRLASSLKSSHKSSSVSFGAG